MPAAGSTHLVQRLLRRGQQAVHAPVAAPGDDGDAFDHGGQSGPPTVALPPKPAAHSSGQCPAPSAASHEPLVGGRGAERPLLHRLERAVGGVDQARARAARGCGGRGSLAGQEMHGQRGGTLHAPSLASSPGNLAERGCGAIGLQQHLQQVRTGSRRMATSLRACPKAAAAVSLKWRQTAAQRSHLITEPFKT